MKIMLISPSILNADYLNLERDIKQLEIAGADSIHVDIMDGKFVKNITWGPPTVAAMKQITSLPIDVHLMVCEPELNIEDYIRQDVSSIFIHPESTIFLRKNLLAIKEAGLKSGVALKLETPTDQIIYCLELVDVVLLLSCDEGFGGGSFQNFVIDKVSALKTMRTQYGLNYKIMMDGGINLETGKLSKNAGADILVAGSYILNADKKIAIENLKNL
ncbi:MAG TPA: ribulose-phosphate 3-epimerase [Pseudogracilibacillus sp.]|nr:ribulose-phosphate 3-epimerase [Pseudogracilibacillus sp.]